MEAKAAAAGYKRGTGKEENHFSRVKPEVKEVPSMQEYESGVKKEQASHEAFLQGPYKDLQARVNAQADTVILADQILDAIKTGKYGPGTSIDQMLSKYAQVLGIPDSPKGRQEYINNLSIEQARKLMSAAGARAAMGAQFTAQESEAWLANFAGINDPKEYIKNMYQLQKAKALIDEDLMNTLVKNPGKEQEAWLKWKASGRRDEIMTQNVDAFKKGPKTTKAAQEPKKTKTVNFNDLKD